MAKLVEDAWDSEYFLNLKPFKYKIYNTFLNYNNIYTIFSRA